MAEEEEMMSHPEEDHGDGDGVVEMRILEKGPGSPLFSFVKKKKKISWMGMGSVVM